MTDPSPGFPSSAGVPGPPPLLAPRMGSDPNKPGSKAYVEQRFGRTATFAERIVPSLIDGFLATAAAIVPVALGVVLIIAGMPDTYDCADFDDYSCNVPGTGSTGLIGLGILLIFLSLLVTWAVIVWNRVWRVTRTGQSVGRQVMGLRLIDARTGAHPDLGPAALRELIHQFAGIISWIWMLFDDDDRTLADIASTTHVIHVDTK